MVNEKRLIIWSIIGTGISSVTTQLLTIREFLTQFHGNEITISLVLFCWLLLAGLGSLAAKLFRGPSVRAYAVVLLVVALWPLLQMLVIRGYRETIFQHGVSPGFYPIFFYIIVTVSPYCLVSGFILPYALKVMQVCHQPFTSGDLYITDSIGDIAGGVLFSFVLVYWFKPFVTIAVSSSLLIATALFLIAGTRSYAVLATAFLFCFVFYYYSTNHEYENSTLSGQYGDVVLYEESPYGRIVVSKEENQVTFWESGVPLYSDANIITSEEKVHYPLCQIDEVRDVLLVSGGLGETLGEISKHGPARVDYVELDPFLTRAALELGALKRVPFLKIINTDGRHHIKTTLNKYDAIIMDLPDPDTFQLNRFFTGEFFSLAKRALNSGGVLSLSLKYSRNYISEVKKRKLSSLYNTALRHFKNVRILPGEEAYFLCRDGKLSTDIPFRLKQKSIKTSYIEGFFYGNITKERIRHIEGCVDADEQVNLDFEPRLMNIVFDEWFKRHGTSPSYFIAVLFVFTVIYIFFMKKEEYVLFSTGFVTMGGEMLIIFAFQVIYGYIYLKIGAIVTAFLVGLLPGAVMGRHIKGKDYGKLMISEAFLLLVLILFLAWITLFKSEPHPSWFLGYCFLFAFSAGFQFPVAAKIIGEEQSPAAGCLAADLCGASVGTLATGTILIPVLGVKVATLFLILVKISSSIFTITLHKQHGSSY